MHVCEPHKLQLTREKLQYLNISNFEFPYKQNEMDLLGDILEGVHPEKLSELCICVSKDPESNLIQFCSGLQKCINLESLILDFSYTR